MNREIKFRAWNKVTGVMYVNHSVSISIDGSVHYLDLTGEWECDTDVNGQKGLVIELMQYTGLKDKVSGTEVFESDICFATFKTKDGYLELRGEIIWDESMWCIRDEKIEHMEYGNTFSLNRVAIIEVIGNIYENPELLSNTISELNVSEG